MSRLRSALYILVLALLLITRAAPDEKGVDVRAFLPGSALAYVELTNLHDTWQRLKTLSLEGLSGEDRAKREKLIHDAYDALLSVARNRAGLELQPLVPEVDAIRWALLGLESSDGRLHPRMVFEIETRTSGFLEKTLPDIVGKRLRGESEVEGFKVYEVWVGMTSPRVDSLYAAVFGTCAVLSTRKEDLAEVLKNVRAGGAKPSLLDSADFQKARTKGGDRPVLLGFASAPGIVSAWLATLDRSARQSMDQLDSWVGYRSLGAVTLVGRIDEDRASVSLCGEVREGADLYQAIRQEPAEMDSLRLFPPDALNVDVILLHDPPKIWERLSAFLKERLQLMDPDAGEETFTSGVTDVEQQIGTPIADVLGVLGEEAALGVLRTAGEETSERDIVLAFAIKDKARASKVLDCVKRGAFAKRYMGKEEMKKQEYRGETLFYGAQEKSLCYVILDKYIALGLDVGRLKRVVDTYQSGEHLGKSALYLDAKGAIPGAASKLVYANLKGLFELLLTRFLDETPEDFKKGTAEGGIVLVTEERQEELAIRAGLGLKGASAAAATALGYLVPKLIEARQEEMKTRCLDRVERLGAKARDWADKHQGEYPLSTDQLGLDAGAFHCEADARAPAAGQAAEPSYRYFPLLAKSPANSILIFEESGIHPTGRCVCHASGDADFLLEEVFLPQMRSQLRAQLTMVDKREKQIEEKLASAADAEKPALEQQKKDLDARKAVLTEIEKRFQ